MILPFVCLLVFIFIGPSRANGNANGTFADWPAVGNGTYWRDGVYQIGQSVQLQWTKQAAIGAYNITIWQQSLMAAAAKQSRYAIYTGTGSDNEVTYPWIITTYEFDVTVSPVFYLSLSTIDAPMTFTSPYFNLSARSESQSSSQLISTTTIISSATSSSTTPTLSAQISPTSTATQSVTTSNTIGIGVGLGIGVPLILVLLTIATLLFQRQRRHLSSLAQTGPYDRYASTGNADRSMAYGVRDQKSMTERARTPVELEGTRGQLVELDDNES